MKSIRSRMAKAMLAAVKNCVSRNWNLNQLNKNGVSLVLLLFIIEPSYGWKNTYGLRA